MSDVVVGFASKTEAYDAAEQAGFDRDSVVVRHCEGDAWRFDWSVREIPEVLTGETATVADALASIDAGCLAVVEAVASMVGGLDEVAGGDPGVADVADDGAASTEGADGAEVGEATYDLPGSADVAREMAEDAAFHASAGGADYEVRIPGRLTVEMAREMAEFAAARLGMPVSLVNVLTGGSSMVLPARGKSVVRAASAGGTVIAREPVARGETMLERARRGVWLDSEVPESNKSILRLKSEIEAAGMALDVAKLEKLGEFKSTSTYYKMARSWLEHWLDYARKGAAAMDAEFGFAG